MQTDKNTVEIKTPFLTLENAIMEVRGLAAANDWTKVKFWYKQGKEIKSTTYARFVYSPKEAEAITDK